MFSVDDITDLTGIVNTCKCETRLVKISRGNQYFGAGGTPSGRSGWNRFGHAGDIMDRTIVVPTGHTASLGHLDIGESPDVGSYHVIKKTFSKVTKLISHLPKTYQPDNKRSKH